jgi:hypothetical protein
MLPCVISNKPRQCRSHSICNSCPFNSLRTLFSVLRPFLRLLSFVFNSLHALLQNTGVGGASATTLRALRLRVITCCRFCPSFVFIHLRIAPTRLSICNLHRFMQLRIALFATPFDSHRCKLPGMSPLPSPPYPRPSDACSARSSSQLAPSRQFSTFNCRTVNFRRHNAKIHPIPL